MDKSDERARDENENTHRPSGFSLSSTRTSSSQTPHHSQQRYQYSSVSPQTLMTSLDPHWNSNNINSINNTSYKNEQKISLPPLTTLESLQSRPSSLNNDYSTPSKRPRTDSVQLPPIPLPAQKELPQHSPYPTNHFSLPSIHFTLATPSTSKVTPMPSRSLDTLQLDTREQVSLPAVSTLLSLSSSSAPSTPPPIVSPQPTYPPTFQRPVSLPRSPQSSFAFQPTGGFQYGLLSPSPHPTSTVFHSPQHQTAFHHSPSPQIGAPYSTPSTPGLAVPSHDTLRLNVPQHTTVTLPTSTISTTTSPTAGSNLQRPKPGTDTAWVNSTFFQIRWEQNYSLLKQFYQLYGHSNVTRAEGQWKPLGNWVAEQRRKLKKGKLTPDQVKKLNELGFEWDRSYYFQQGRDSSEDELRSGTEEKPSQMPSNTDNNENNNNTTPTQPGNNDTSGPNQTNGTQTGGS